MLAKGIGTKTCSTDSFLRNKRLKRSSANGYHGNPLKSCRIAVYRPGRIDDDDTRLGNLMGEGVALLKKFNSVFRKRSQR